MNLQEFCLTEIEAYRKFNQPKGLMFKEWFYNNSKKFTKVNEELSRKISEDENCKIKECYRNAWISTVCNSHLKYFEGYVASMSIPIPHAWLVDTDGMVVDPTLIINGERMVKQLKKYGVTDRKCNRNRLGDEYFGMEIPIDFVNKMTFKKKITGEWIFEYFRKQQEQNLIKLEQIKN